MEFFTPINEFRPANKRITTENLASGKYGTVEVAGRFGLIEKISFCANIAADEESASLSLLS